MFSPSSGFQKIEYSVCKFKEAIWSLNNGNLTHYWIWFFKFQKFLSNFLIAFEWKFMSCNSLQHLLSYWHWGDSMKSYWAVILILGIWTRKSCEKNTTIILPRSSDHVETEPRTSDQDTQGKAQQRESKPLIHSLFDFKNDMTNSEASVMVEERAEEKSQRVYSEYYLDWCTQK